MKTLNEYLNNKNGVVQEGTGCAACKITNADRVNKTIEESANLIAALEAVGAMYGIPSSSIIADDTTNKITVHEDMIIAPPVSAQGQNKAIVQAVGAVLDYISQRIDQKLDNFQTNNMSKEPEEVTPSDTNPGQSYFGDEDDIAANIDLEASPNVSANDISGNEVNVPAEIQESAYHVNMMAKLGDTTHLGYDLLRRHGFDFVKPIDALIQEAASSEEKEDTGKKKKKIKLEEIKRMKFDNKGILNAIKYFNAAREEQDNIKAGTKIDKKAFINSDNYQKGIKALNSQFNCSMNIKFVESGKELNAFTSNYYNTIMNNVTVSKSKGFQLNGMPINIYIVGNVIDANMAPNDNEIFGQNFVSIILHELFHNIYFALASENAKMGLSLTMTMALASAAKDVKEKRVIITNYVDSLDAVHKSTFMNAIAKKRMIKQLMALSAINDTGAKKFKDEADRGEVADEYVDTLIKKYKRVTSYTKMDGKFAIANTVLAALSVTAGVITCGATGAFFGTPFLIYAGTFALSDMIRRSELKAYDNKRFYEEYWCDLFAGMYNLPVKFFIGSSVEKYVPNEITRDKLNELAKVEKELHRSVMSSYPTTLERNHASVTIAKQILADKSTDEALKKYAKWIVDNFDSVHNTDIKTIYNQTTFKPSQAEDLDKHMQKLIEDNNIVTTEAYKLWTGKE